MRIPDQIQLYLKIIGILLFIFYLFYSMSTAQFSCEKWSGEFKNKEEFHLILTNKSAKYRDGYLNGIDIYTGKYTEYKDGSGWIAYNIDTFRIGDTLIKDLGKYSIIIKRKDTTISLPFKCENNVYK